MYPRMLTTILLPAMLPVLLSGAAEKTLPDLMALQNGAPVVTKADWQRRRGEMTEILLHWQYGHVPPVPMVRAGSRAA